MFKGTQEENLNNFQRILLLAFLTGTAGFHGRALAQKNWTWYIHSTNIVSGTPSYFDLTIGIRADSESDVGRLGMHDIEGTMSTDLYDFGSGYNPTLSTNHLAYTPGYGNMTVNNPTEANNWELITQPYTGGSGNGVTVTTAGIPVGTIRFTISNAIGSSNITFNETVDLTWEDNNTKVSLSYNNTGGNVAFNSNVYTKVKLFLEGAYQTESSMTTDLNTGDLIPLDSPYSEAPREASSIPSGVTDWILIQLRAAPEGTTSASQSFFLKNDGTVVDLDGTTTDLLINGVLEGNYHIIVKHRNHLKVMSASTVPLNSSSSTTYDFTTGTGQYYGGDAKLVDTSPTNKYGMYKGDTDGSGTVDANDRAATWNDRNDTGYNSSDCCLSGTVDANDRAATWNNRNKSTNVPTQ
jgi:hypothetical protein